MVAEIGIYATGEADLFLAGGKGVILHLREVSLGREGVVERVRRAAPFFEVIVEGEVGAHLVDG